MNQTRGFTLIEIMIVLMIIGFFALIVYGSLSGAAGRARDAERMKLLSDLDFAIAQYNEDHGSYPEAGCGAGENWVMPEPAGGSFTQCEGEYIVGLVPEYLPRLPRDPRNSADYNQDFAYRVIDNEYKVMVFDSVESLFVEDQEDKLSRCDSSCLLNSGWGDRCTDEEFFRTYALYTDRSPGNQNGSECY